MSELVKRFQDFGKGTLRNCPICDALVTGFTLYEKFEPEMFSLYVRPCNHRLGLWSSVPEWNKEVGLPVQLITYEDQERGYDLGFEKQRLAAWNEKVTAFQSRQNGGAK